MCACDKLYLEYLQSFWVWDKYVDTASLNDANSYLYNKTVAYNGCLQWCLLVACYSCQCAPVTSCIWSICRVFGFGTSMSTLPALMMQIPTCIIKPLPTMVAYNGAYWQLVTAASVRLWQVYLEYLQSFWVWDKYVDTASLNDANSYLYNKTVAYNGCLQWCLLAACYSCQCAPLTSCIWSICRVFGFGTSMSTLPALMMQIPTCIIKPLPTMVAYNGAYW